MIEKEMESEEMEKEMESEESFAALFEANPETPSSLYSPGDTVSGAVVKISKEAIFVDLGGKSEGVADLHEFQDKDGTLTVAVGDRITLKVASLTGGLKLSKGLKVRGAEALELLREVQRNSVPVEGKITAVNKGGFDVEIAGIRAFCPMSQIDIRFCENLEEHVGAKYTFRIMEFKERGRNIIVSRRVILQEEQEIKAKETLAILKPGQEFEGKITRLAKFGAFVDIGGIEGMVHVSEISHARVNDPSEVLQTGQMVKVKVISVEPGDGRRRRIALSIKALEPDAWEKGLEFNIGDIIPGKVTKLMDFGAFVGVAKGVEGLVHVSEISFERVAHPSAVLKEGDMVNVLVLDIDYTARRISLSLKEAAAKQQVMEDEHVSGKARLEVGQVLKGIVEKSKPYGLFVRLPQLGLGVRGLLPTEELRVSGDVIKKFSEGKEITVEVASIDEKGRIGLSLRALEEKKERAEYSQFLGKEENQGKLGTLEDLFKNLKR